MMKTRSSRSSSSRSAWFKASRYVIRAIAVPTSASFFHVNVFGQLGQGRFGALVGELDRVIHHRGLFLVDLVEHRGRNAPLMRQQSAEAFDRVALLPQPLLALGA